jgi:hypothetical protein
MRQHVTSLETPLLWIRGGIESSNEVQLTTFAQLAAVYANQWINGRNLINQTGSNV